ncbi:glycosyltransferase family 4 protein [Methyloversatilis sp. XJ19-13]|uniref:glycosyltransferase family 4 protein n=1 Tax=Methyloversatilis sp. XJ19-13 TaxID=2963430 RepID=UPI00211BC9AA|nr:glycosyltransferase family 4 protein [Methyloversatilis sp. XJ19-13]MCQ9372924.1 glycosyltransferase family 4 protein [Methyloversatilis sp. XJ19-13]
MHIGVVAPEFPPELGGMQTYAVEFVRALAARGHTVTVFTRTGPDTEAGIPGVEVRRVLRERRHADRAILATPGIDAWHVMNACYAWVAAEVAPVVISVHGNDFLDPYLPVERPNLGRIPLLWKSDSLRPTIEYWLARPLTRRSVARNLPRARAILANSRYTADVLLAQLPACRGKVIPAMVGVSPAFFDVQPGPRLHPDMELVTVCRLDERRKNIDQVLRALAQLAPDHAFNYRVVGEGARRTELQALAAELGIADRVEFTGRLAFDALRSALARADLFVLAASIEQGSHEGFGIAYIEANAAGTPVLAARLAGAAEAVDEGRSGLFVDDTDVTSLVSALRKVLSGELRFDPEACRAFARRFSWDSVVEQALPFYGVDAPRSDPTQNTAGQAA